jgi:hypothetical protein
VSLSFPRKRSLSWLHALLLGTSLAVHSPAVASLETPLPDGTYRAERGYNAVRDICPSRIEIAEVKIVGGKIEFESSGSIWTGIIDAKTGVIRIETAGIRPRPTAELIIRGHHTKAQMFSTICGAGYFRVLR